MTQLVKNNDSLLPAITPNITDEDFSKYAKSSKFLQRIQLYGSSSKLCKMGRIPQGHFGVPVSKDKIDDLGDSFDCLVIQYRLKAMDINGDRPVSFFDKDSESFQKIVDASSTKDSGCMWGPEFLLWLPNKKCFASMFFCNPTMRNVAEELKALHGNFATISSVLIDTKKYMWHGPKITACTTPYDLPDMAGVVEENTKFIKLDQEPVQVLEDDDDTPQRDR